MSTTSAEKFEQKLYKVLKGISAPISARGKIEVDCQPITITLKSNSQNFSIQPAKDKQGTTYLSSEKRLSGQADMLKDLVNQMPQASFGHGQETKQDKSVRDAFQLPAKDFEVNIPQEKIEEILLKVKKDLLLETDIVAEPYSLNVYKKGGKFVKHKDTPRGDDMLGTLVIMLPSLFTGGEFEVSMGNEKDTYLKEGCYSWWNKNDANVELPWCAFFADVDHEIKPVHGGVRITLAYCLRRKDAQSAVAQLPRPVLPDEQACIIKQEIENALRDESFLEDGGTIGYPCLHLYTNGEVFPKDANSDSPLSAKQIKKLKGRDLMVAKAAVHFNLEVYLVPYLSHTCGGGYDFRLRRFPKKKKRQKYMSDDDIELAFDASRDDDEYPHNHADVWILPFGDSEQAKKCVGECANYNAEGYFGNEASDTVFYVKAALHVKVPGTWEDGRSKFIKDDDDEEEE